MAEYIPKINLPIEGVEHARWLERRSVDQGRQIEEILRILKSLGAANAAVRPTTAITNSEGSGVPMPTLTGGVLRGKGGTFGPVWSYDWQGLVPHYYVFMDPTGSYYGTAGMSLAPNYSSDATLSASLLPPVVFTDAGMTMLPIDFGGYGDNPADIYSGRAEVPINLDVKVFPSFDGEEFTINPPTYDNDVGVTAPWYSFSLSNPTAFSATVNIADTDLFYPAGTAVNGDVDVWTIPAGYQAGWFVQNVVGWGATATPARYVGVGGALFWSDPDYTP